MNFVICDDDKADAGRLKVLLEKYSRERFDYLRI